MDSLVIVILVLMIEYDKFIIQFNDMDRCYEWMERNTLIFPKENYLMIGNETDSLVKAYHFFRIPESIYHLLLYIGEGKCYYDGENNDWQTIYKDVKPMLHQWILDTIQEIKNANGKNVKNEKEQEGKEI